MILKILLKAQCESRLNGTRDIGCSWTTLASELDLDKQRNRHNAKNLHVQTSEQHVRQLISQIKKKAKVATKNSHLELINSAVDGRYVLNEEIVLL